MLAALGVSGGIAAYKACEIVRGLDRAGVAVQVLLTRNARRFVAPLALETLSRRPVLSRVFEPAAARSVRHVDLAREAAVLVVAPATADVLAKFAGGIADDLLSTFYLAMNGPVLVAPAMNTRMLLHPATQANLRALRRRGVRVIEPESGWLAEGEIGWGRMADPERIVAATLAALGSTRRLSGRTVVVTAGPTREAIDPVRFLSNRSSGKMGYAIAAACARRGARVVLISGPVVEAPPFGVELVSVETAGEMREAVLRARAGASAVFMAAAVADWVPRAAAQKIKREGKPLALTLEEGPDILAELGSRREEQVLVGFAAETEALLEHARQKLERKNVDWIVANDVAQAGIGFDSDDNAVTLVGRQGTVEPVARASKVEIAEAIVERILCSDEAPR